jgi:hypothetical protein
MHNIHQILLLITETTTSLPGAEQNSLREDGTWERQRSIDRQIPRMVQIVLSINTKRWYVGICVLNLEYVFGSFVINSLLTCVSISASPPGHQYVQTTQFFQLIVKLQQGPTVKYH